jgi:predicted amidohydrolase YtcJ
VADGRAVRLAAVSGHKPSYWRRLMAAKKQTETTEEQTLGTVQPVDGKKVKPDADGDIDARMAALREDQIEMGAREKGDHYVIQR